MLQRATVWIVVIIVLVSSSMLVLGVEPAKLLRDLTALANRGAGADPGQTGSSPTSRPSSSATATPLAPIRTPSSASPTPAGSHAPTPRPTPTPAVTPRPTSSATPTPAPTPKPTPTPLPSFSHVFVILMENEESASVIGNALAPYINSLANSYGLGTQYYATSHPSLPNYLALTAGSTFGITSDCTTCFVNSTNLADQIEASGRSWKAYMESMPSACLVGDSGQYMQKHDPWIYYNDIRTNTARCAAHIVPFTQFGTDMASGAVPNFVWITPNMCNDMHDCSISTGDSWLSQHVPTILNSSAYKNNGALFIVWDEGTTNTGCCTNASGGRVAMLVISPLAKPGLKSAVAETHYSLLRTIEDSWGLTRLNGAACSCTAEMREYFR